jgi:hypothetical protein
MTPDEKRTTDVSDTEDHSDLWAAYTSTTFVAKTDGGSIRIHVAEPCPALDRLLLERGQESWCFITAWNPGTDRPTREENEKRNLQLRQDLESEGCEIFEGCGVGEDPNWEPEPSFLVLGISEVRAARLGRAYGQFAIVVGKRAGKARLLDCREKT